MHNKITFMILILGLVASISGASLSYIYSVTAPIIEQRTLNQKIKPSLSKFFKEIGVDNDYIADNVTLDLGVDDWGRKQTAKAFLAKSGGKPVAVAIQTKAGGFGGDISVLTAFDIGQSKTLLGVKTLDQKETKGLGSRIADDSEPFIQQFTHMPYTKEIKLNADGGTVDGISGATVSSVGFAAAVNGARGLLEKYQGEITGKEVAQ